MADHERETLDTRAQRARSDLEQQLAPEPPPWHAPAANSGRRLALTAAAILAVVAVVAGVLATRDGTKQPVKPAAESPVSPGSPVKVQLIRSDKARTGGDAGAIPAAVTADTAFAADVFGKVASVKQGNFFLSPHSISMALSMAMAGANGSTLAQMEKVLHVDIPEPAFHDAINALDRVLTAPRKARRSQKGAHALEVVTANSLWGQSGYPFRRQFLDRIAESYGAGMNVVDFVKRAEASRSAINAWVANHTDGKITELIPKGIIDEMTRLVLVNAITFKASWEKKFDPAVPGPFTTAAGTRVTARMMSGGTGAYATGPGWKSAAIPYVGGAHLVVILPDDIRRFALSPQILRAAAAGHQRANVTLPKFSVTSQLTLNPILEALGLTDAFDAGTANLSRIDGRACPAPDCLFVTAVVHQAVIKVDEKGTEAAAATAVVVGAQSTSVAEPPSVVVNKPFVFAIRDDATGAILFAGRVTDPTA